MPSLKQKMLYFFSGEGGGDASLQLATTDRLFYFYGGHGGEPNDDIFSDGGSAPIADGGSVQQWTDEDAALSPDQTIETAKPTYRESVVGLNGRGAVEFDGGDYLIEETALLGAEASWTWAIVIKSAHAGGGVVAGEGRSVSGNPMLRFDTINNNIYLGWRDNVASSVNAVSTSVINDGAVHLIVATLIANTLSIYVDDLTTAEDSVDASGQGATTTDRHTLGAITRDTTIEIWDGQLALSVAWRGDHLSDCEAIKTHYGIT